MTNQKQKQDQTCYNSKCENIVINSPQLFCSEICRLEHVQEIERTTQTMIRKAMRE